MLTAMPTAEIARVHCRHISMYGIVFCTQLNVISKLCKQITVKTSINHLDFKLHYRENVWKTYEKQQRQEILGTIFPAHNSNSLSTL